MSQTNEGTSFITCSVTLPDGMECGGEIEIEWSQFSLPPRKTGDQICHVCAQVYTPGTESETLGKDDECEDFEGGLGAHEWIDEYVEGDFDQELISYKTWCWHPLTREQAREALNNIWAAGEGQAAENRL